MKERLTKTDWLDHGLRVLASSGINAVKAEPLARSLRVTRGSFYWHFRDIGDFHDELLARWRERSTDEVIKAVDEAHAGRARLEPLIALAMSADHNLERAIRTWAIQDATVAKVVSAVDHARLAYVVDILRSAGVDEKDIQPRANLVYWANIGRMIMGVEATNVGVEDLRKISELLLS